MTGIRASRAAPAAQPLPEGFRLQLDASAHELAPGVWFGGSPARVLRLTGPGHAAWQQLHAAGVGSAAAGTLARRLTDAGLAHPVPPRAAPLPDVTVLVPVLDRAAELERCLTAVGGGHPVVVVDDGSADPAAVAAVADRHGARLVRRAVTGGPAAARNAGLAVVETEAVAFLDSDCVPPAGWLAPLLAQLADPLVAAVAPRIAGIAPDTWAGRYTEMAGSLDLGSRSSRVMPGARVPYVPTAALVARRAALLDISRRGHVFDPALRYGEDVDLVWRLHEAGWRVRYEPAVQVAHREPARWRELLPRRFRYGTSAAPLTRAHPAAAAPLAVHPWPTATVLALLARRPALAAATFGISVGRTVRTLRAADVPTSGTARAVADATRQTWLGLGRYATQFAGPVLVAATVVPGRPGRRLAALSLLLGGPLTAWWPHRDRLDPARFVAGRIADEIAYGAGVLAGCRTARSLAAVRPVVVRSGLTRPTTPPARPVPIEE